MELSPVWYLLIVLCISFARSTDLGLVKRASPSPSPVAVSPSQNWDGDDGPWSSFTLVVGSPAQNVRVLVSTTSDDTLVVSQNACGANSGQCADSRGGTFNPNASTTWQQHGYYVLNLEENQALHASAYFGNDTVALGIQGSGGPILQDQIVGSFTSPSLYIGMFGVNPSSTNFSAQDQNRPSYMTSLKQQGMIPSLSFGYTAGNQYRLKQVFGSLTLGGYDSSLFTPNSLTIPIASDPLRSLMVGVQSIKSQNQNGTGATLSMNGIMALLDSTVAMFYLPEAVCQEFERAFNLTADAKTGLYLVDDDLHDQLQQQNASITFTIGATVSGGKTVDIVLPYNSFDLQVNPPAAGVSASQKYFPLSKAGDDSQSTLGRAFLQEAYLIVDWERQNFSISQCVFAEGHHQTLVPITSMRSSSSSTTGRTVGIAVGVSVAVVLIIAALTFFFLLRRRRRRLASASTTQTGEDPSDRVRQGFAKGELGTGTEYQRYEMEGTLGPKPNPHGNDGQASPGWVDEKNRTPGDHLFMAEADGSSNAIAELHEPRTTYNAFHEMPGGNAQPRFELAADTPGELHGSTPSSSKPGSPISPNTPWSRGHGSFFGKPSSPLSAPSTDSPHPSPIDRSPGQPSHKNRHRSTQLLGSLRHSIGNRSSSGASAPSPGLPSESATSPRYTSPSTQRGSSPAVPGEMTQQQQPSEAMINPVSRQGTFQTLDEVTSPVSPDTPQDTNSQGLFGRLKRGR